jgi:putative tricarboxylic transport membrane protein
MLRGIFMTPDASKDQINYYVDLLKKVRDTAEWKALIDEGAFNTTFLTGDEFVSWVDKEEQRHRLLMKEAGFIAGQ